MSVIDTTRDNAFVSGTAEADSITNSGDNATIDALAGDDTVKSSGAQVSIDGGAGNNLVSLASDAYLSVVAGSGNDTVCLGDSDETAEKQFHSNVNISGGNNYIRNAAELSTINAGAGNDTIITGCGVGNSDYNDAYGRSDVLGTYSDKYASVAAGAGDNQITVTTYMYQGRISTKDGNDTVLTAESSNSTINAGNGNNFVTIGGSGEGNEIIAGKGDDFISLASSSTGNAISVGSGNNTVYGEGIGQSVSAGGGNIMSVCSKAATQASWRARATIPSSSATTGARPPKSNITTESA